MNGSRVAPLVFGVCLCTITVTTFQLQHGVISHLNPQVHSSSSRRDIFVNEIQKLTRDDFNFEHFHNAGSDVLQYSLASRLVCIVFFSLFFHYTKIKTRYILVSSIQNVTHLQIEHTHILNIGHRGSPYTALENTGRSFIHAAQVGADGVELDVFLLKCGTLVVFHGSGDDNNPGLLKSYCDVEGSM